MFILAPVLMLTAAPPPNANWNCDEPEVQQEMNWCAQQGFLVADAELNIQWRLNSAILKERDIQWMDGHGNAEQPSALSPEPWQRHARRCLLWQSTSHPQTARKDQT